VELQLYDSLTSALVGSGRQILVPATLTSLIELTLLSLRFLHDFHTMNAQVDNHTYLPVRMLQVKNCGMDFDATRFDLYYIDAHTKLVLFGP
jgi:hypothetical protein